jgi:hypothetical protein
MKVKTTYVQMFAHNQRAVPPLLEGSTVLHAKKPTVTPGVWGLPSGW